MEVAEPQLLVLLKRCAWMDEAPMHEGQDGASENATTEQALGSCSSRAHLAALPSPRPDPNRLSGGCRYIVILAWRRPDQATYEGFQ